MGCLSGEGVELHADVFLVALPAQPASVHGVGPARVGEGAGCLGGGLVDGGGAKGCLPGVSGGENREQGVQDGGRCGGGDCHVPHAVADRCFVGGDGPLRATGCGVVVEEDPQGERLVGGDGGVVFPGAVLLPVVVLREEVVEQGFVAARVGFVGGDPLDVRGGGGLRRVG